MKPRFLDTSALAKLFHEEQGSAFVERIVSDPDSEIWILDLSRVEFLSSVYRRYREGKLSTEDVAELADLFEQQVSEFKIESLGPVILEEAEQLMRECESPRSVDQSRSSLGKKTGRFVFLSSSSRSSCQKGCRHFSVAAACHRIDGRYRRRC